MKKYGRIVATLSVGMMALALSAAAQTSTGTTATTPTTPLAKQPQTVDQRHANQQKRVGEGLENGSLTAGEAKHIESKEQNLNKEESNMRKADNGKLTSADKAKLQGQENKLSKDIYSQKHDAQHQQMGGGEIIQRKRDQQKRIGEGLENGSVTSGEAKKLENQQQGINKTELGMRQADGGKLTQGDKKAINQQQNQASKNIYHQKHDAQHQPHKH